MRKMILLTILLSALAMTGCSNREEREVKKLVKTQYAGAKVVSVRRDSCFSITRPLMSLRYEALHATTREEVSDIYNEAMRLNNQLMDRHIDNGGLKVPCYIVDYVSTYGNGSMIIIVEPSGELVTDYDEYKVWIDALDKIGEKANMIYSDETTMF